MLRLGFPRGLVVQGLPFARVKLLAWDNKEYCSPLYPSYQQHLLFSNVISLPIPTTTTTLTSSAMRFLLRFTYLVTIHCATSFALPLTTEDTRDKSAKIPSKLPEYLEDTKFVMGTTAVGVTAAAGLMAGSGPLYEKFRERQWTTQDRKRARWVENRARIQVGKMLKVSQICSVIDIRGRFTVLLGCWGMSVWHGVGRSMTDGKP